MKSNNSLLRISVDIKPNLRSIERDYQTLGDDLWERFNVKEKSKHKWYYSSIIENIKHLKDTKEYKEYKDLLEIFN